MDDEGLDDLLAGVAAGDRAAFDRLYARTSAKLYGVSRRILGDDATAREALQEVYVRVWQGASNYDASRGRPITWLASITRNRAVDMRRHANARGAMQRAEIDPDALAAIPSDAAGAEEIAALRACLEGLRVEHRDAVLRAYCYGWSREEIAAHGGQPVGTIKSWLNRGLTALKACLTDG